MNLNSIVFSEIAKLESLLYDLTNDNDNKTKYVDRYIERFED